MTLLSLLAALRLTWLPGCRERYRDPAWRDKITAMAALGGHTQAADDTVPAAASLRWCALICTVALLAPITLTGWPI